MTNRPFVWHLALVVSFNLSTKHHRVYVWGWQYLEQTGLSLHNVQHVSCVLFYDQV